MHFASSCHSPPTLCFNDLLPFLIFVNVIFLLSFCSISWDRGILYCNVNDMALFIIIFLLPQHSVGFKNIS